MKNLIIQALFSRLRIIPNLKKKLIIFGIASVSGLILVGSIGVYLAFQGVQYISGVISSKTPSAATVTEYKEKLLDQTTGLNTVTESSCYQTLTQFTQPEFIFSKSLFQHFENVRTSCLEKSTQQAIQEKEDSII
jgi:hypothetical protein